MASPAFALTDPIIQMLGPLTVANNTVSVYGRNYVVGNGFINSIQILGSQALAGPVSLIVESSGVAETFTDQSITITQQTTQAVNFAVTSNSANVQLSNTVHIENDGFVYFTCQVTPQPGKSLQCLRVKFPVEPSLAQLYGTSQINGSANTYADSGQYGYTSVGTMDFSQCYDIWLGTNSCGLQVFGGEDVATWSGWTATDAMQIYMTSSTAGVEFDVEPNSTYLKSAYSFEFGLIATPVKSASMNPNVRMGFGQGNTSDIYSDEGQAQMDVTSLINPMKSVITAGFTLNAIDSATNYVPTDYDILAVEGPGCAACHVHLR